MKIKLRDTNIVRRAKKRVVEESTQRRVKTMHSRWIR